jgi:hypothetical protein
MHKSSTSPSLSLNNRQIKDKDLILKTIVEKVESGVGLNLIELKIQFNEEQLFAISLKYVTTTKKALCTAMKIPVEAGCRYKRKLEKNGSLVQSVDAVFCPFTRHKAHLISTNQEEFEKLQKSNSNQTKLF